MDRLISMAVFVAAIEEGSIAAAARRMGLSPVMAGRYLTALEEALPARLVQRATRSLSLTDAGMRYLPRCRRILEELEEANHEAAATQGTARGTLRIAAPVTFGAQYLGPVVAAYMARHPEVQVQVHLHDRFVDLIDEGIDLALRIGQLADSSLVAWPLSQCMLLACASPAYLSRAGVPRSPHDLARHDRIGYIGSTPAAPWSFTARSGSTVEITEPCRLMANNTQLMAQAAASGLGIAYGPSFAFAELLERGELVQVLPRHATPRLPIHAITPSARQVPQKVRAFRDALGQAFGEGQAPWERWRRGSPAD